MKNIDKNYFCPLMFHERFLLIRYVLNTVTHKKLGLTEVTDENSSNRRRTALVTYTIRNGFLSAENCENQSGFKSFADNLRERLVGKIYR